MASCRLPIDPRRVIICETYDRASKPTKWPAALQHPAIIFASACHTAAKLPSGCGSQPVVGKDKFAMRHLPTLSFMSQEISLWPECQ